MLFPLKTRRSAGIPVTASVHRILARGNAARDRQDWDAAVAAYRAALRSDPALAHIWVQLGHAAKEARDFVAAEDAYVQAARLRPGDADPHLHMGHMFSRSGDHARAGEHYLRAFRADPGLPEAATALHRAIARARGTKRDELLDLLRAATGATAVTASRPPPDGIAFVFDVSDLIGYFGHARTPTGIQRVQIQIIAHALRPPDAPVRLCCFIDGRDEWQEVPEQRLSPLFRLSQEGSDRTDPAWVAALHSLHLHLALALPFAFPRGSFLVNLGASWQLPNYFLFVRAAKARYGISYVPLIHDLISVVMPEHFTRAAVQEVVPWLLGVFAHADHLLAVSEATRRDLLAMSGIVGSPLDPANIAVIRLDADFRTPGLTPIPSAEAEPFVLLVSTIEPRKGHTIAFEAWTRLIAERGAARVPKLVCVGKRGWLSAAVYRQLEADPVLASRVSMRGGVSDTELAGLYEACLFTIYPSLYEGWGLPVTEALSYGKPVIASDTSSLPEAGGSYAVYVPPGSAGALADAAGRMVSDAPYREAIARRIRAEFRPRSWSDLAEQVQAQLVALARRDHVPPAAPVARLGAYHSVARSTARRLWPGIGVGEVFRVGTGWTSPEAEGSWTRAGGGRLCIGLPPGARALRVGLLLLGSPHADLAWLAQARNGPTLSGRLARGRRAWTSFTFTGQGDGPLDIWLQADPDDSEADRQQAGPDAEEPVIGLAGFFLYEAADEAAGRRLFEAIAMDNLDEVDAYRPPPPAARDHDWS